MAFDTRFCSSRRSRRRSDRTTREQGTKVRSSPFVAARGADLELDLAHQLVDTEACEFRAERAVVQARHIEERAEDFLHGLERSVDIVDQPAIFAAAALDQARDVKARGVERLQ